MTQSQNRKASPNIKVHAPRTTTQGSSDAGLPSVTENVPPSISSKPSQKPSAHGGQWFALITAFFGILAPALYLVGYLYTDGYISALGLQTDLYARSPDQYITRSLFVILETMGKLIPEIGTLIMAVIACVGAFILLCATVQLIMQSTWLRTQYRTRSEKWKSAFTSKLVRVSLQSSFLGFLAIYIPMLFTVLLAIFTLPIHSLGAKAAHARIDDFLADGGCAAKKVEDNSRTPVCLTFSSNGFSQSIEGIILLSSDKAITVFDAHNNRIKTLFLKDAVMIDGKLQPHALSKSR
jgi:hypothetical protein